MCFIGGERHALCGWRRLEGCGETDPPVTAGCELWRPMGGQRLCPPPSAQPIDGGGSISEFATGRIPPG